MTLHRINHAYVQEMLLGDSTRQEVYWLVLRDRIIEREVDIRYIRERALDPLAQAILNCLPKRDDQAVDITHIAQAINVTTEGVGTRVVGTMLYILAQANCVKVTYENGIPCFLRTDSADKIRAKASYQALRKR